METPENISDVLQTEEIAWSRTGFDTVVNTLYDSESTEGSIVEASCKTIGVLLCPKQSFPNDCLFTNLALLS